MAADLNNFSGTGRLTKDAESKEVAGKTLVTCDIANNTGFGDSAKCTYIKLNLWGKAGSGVFPYLKKGQLIGFNGQLSRNDWEGRDGITRTDIIVNGTCVLLGSSNNNNNNRASQEPPADEVTF